MSFSLVAHFDADVLLADWGSEIDVPHPLACGAAPATAGTCVVDKVWVKDSSGKYHAESTGVVSIVDPGVAPGLVRLRGEDHEAAYVALGVIPVSYLARLSVWFGTSILGESSQPADPAGADTGPPMWAYRSAVTDHAALSNLDYPSSGHTGFAPAAHVHNGADVTSGTLNGDRLPALSQTTRGGVPATGVPSDKFLRDDGTWQAAGSGAGSISVVLIDPSPASVNLSNEGIIDWFATTEANPPRTLAYSVLHSKPLGGQMMLSFDGVCGAASGVSWGLASTTPTAPLRTTNAGDDTGYLLTNNPFFTYIGDTSGAVLTGFGFRFRVPARVTSQVLRIYTGTSYRIEITMTAHLTDGSVADVVNVYDQPATGNHPICYKVTFQSAEAGAELEIKILCTKRYGTYGYVCFWAATLAAS